MRVLSFWWARLARRFWLLLLPIGLLTALGLGGFGYQLAAQKHAVATYQAQISKMKRQLPTAAALMKPQLAYERRALDAGAIKYAAAYKVGLGYTSTNNVMTPQGTPRVNVMPLATLKIGEFKAGEVSTTLAELTQVNRQRLVPMYPARLLLNEQSRSAFTGDDSQYADAVTRTAKRFYEHSWYFLQHSLTQTPVVVGLLIALLLAFGWWQTLGGADATLTNRLLTLLNVGPEATVLGGYALSVVSAWVVLLVSGGLILGGTALMNGTGSLAYPLLRWQGMTTDFMPLWQNLLLQLLLLALLTSFFLAVAQLLATLIRNVYLRLGAMVALVIAGVVLPPHQWLPTSALHIGQVADNYLFVTLSQDGGFTPVGSVGQVIGTLIGWTVLVLGAALVSYRLRQRWVR